MTTFPAHPQAGHAVRLTGPFMAPLSKPGDVGILGGTIGENQTDKLGSITFGCYAAFRGDNQSPGYVSCSGGPATFSGFYDRAKLKPTGEWIERRFWRWSEPRFRRAHSGQEYTLRVPVWEWAGRDC